MLEIHLHARVTVSGLEYELRELERDDDGLRVHQQAKTARTIPFGEIGEGESYIEALATELFNVAYQFRPLRG